MKHKNQRWGASARRGGATVASFLALFLALACLAAAPALSPSGGGTVPLTSPGLGRHKIRVSTPAAAAWARARGGRLVADYGAFQVFELPTVSAAAGIQGAELHDEYNLLLFNAGEFDTSKAAAKALRKNVASFEGKRLHLVQFAGPVQANWRAELEAVGAQIIAYIPNNAYLVYGDFRSLGRVQALATTAPHIQWDGPFADEYKLEPSVRSQSLPGGHRAGTTNQFAVQLVADPVANAETLQLVERLKLSPIKQQRRVLNCLDFVVGLAPETLSQLAARPDVLSIQAWSAPQKSCERADQIVAGNLAGVVPAGPGYLAWLASKGFTQEQFTASGFLVDISDSGIDNGTIIPNHFGLFVGGDVSNSSRVVYSVLAGTPNSDSTLAGYDGHGTLNAHIICGYDDQAGFPFADASGYHYGLGVCPFVAVGASVIFDPDFFTFPNYNDLLSTAYQAGARISNNSWNLLGDNTYNGDAQNYDALVRDAQPLGSAFYSESNQEMVIVFSVGNGGNITAPATAKNVISVGAAENVQAFGGADGIGVGDDQADSANDVAAISSRGPCSGGRHKPDLVAPGTHVSGGVIQASSPGPLGTADPYFDGFGISGGTNGSLFWPDGQQFYTASSGSSQAAACVSGGCALLRQYFINNFTNPPSPAMTKAWLMNSARYLTGASANDTLWSDAQGMGEMDLGAAFDGIPRMFRDQVPNDLFTASGQCRSFGGRVCNTNKPLRVTLAWTDAPGCVGSVACNNDLDLLVVVGGVPYKGNVFNRQWSTNGGGADSINNVESVYLPPGTTGPFLVRVVAANINSDGVPGNEFPLDQDFALVVYNATPGPFIESAGSELLVESCSPTNGVIDAAETVAMSFTVTNVGTVVASNLVATLLPGGGVLAPGGPQTYGMVAAGGAAASRVFTFTADGLCGDTITATLRLQDGSSDLGTVTYTLPLGRTRFALQESFDAASPPSLPNGWSTTARNLSNDWVTTTSSFDTPPNAAFAAEPRMAWLGELKSPVVPIVTASAQLSFQNWFNLFNNYEGGVLEISIGGGDFTNFAAAGGSFVSGGYNGTLASDGDNPLAGCPAWTGDSGGFEPTVVNLPANAAGQNVQLRWLFATDSTHWLGNGGWRIDTVALTDGFACCLTAPAFWLQPSNQTVLAGMNATFQPTPSGSQPLSYQWQFNYTNMDGMTMPALTLTNVQLWQAGDYLMVVTNAAGMATSQVAHLTVALPPAVTVGVTPGNMAFSLPSVSGVTYQLEYKNSLSDPNWLPISPAISGNGSDITLHDLSPPPSRRFYRVRCY